MDGKDLVWDHFKFNAEQRLRGFNFFVLLSIFADGGVFLIGLITAAVWTVSGLWSSWRAPDDFTRTSLPGTLTVQVQDTGSEYLYVEHQHGTPVPTLQELGLEVRGPTATSVHVEPAGLTMEYDAPAGHLGTLVGTLDAATPEPTRSPPRHRP